MNSPQNHRRAGEYVVVIAEGVQRRVCLPENGFENLIDPNGVSQARCHKVLEPGFSACKENDCRRWFDVWLPRNGGYGGTYLFSLSECQMYDDDSTVEFCLASSVVNQMNLLGIAKNGA